MKRITTAILCMFALTMSAYAQRDIVKSLQTDVVGQGKVTIHQDDKITALVGGSTAASTVNWSIPVFCDTIFTNSILVILYFFFYYYSPRWLCRVGNFASIEEADAMMRQLKKTGVFKEVSIVRDQITLTIK